MYRSLGRLGQTAATVLPAGGSVTLNFSLVTTDLLTAGTPTLLAIAISNFLNSWSLFQNSQLELQTVNVSSDWNQVSITFEVGPNAMSSYTYGAIGAAIASQVSSGVPGVNLSPQALGPGLGVTSFLTQLTQAGGISLNPVSSVNLQTDASAVSSVETAITSALPGLANVPSWELLAGAGVALVVLWAILS